MTCDPGVMLNLNQRVWPDESSVPVAVRGPLMSRAFGHESLFALPTAHDENSDVDGARFGSA